MASSLAFVKCCFGICYMVCRQNVSQFTVNLPNDAKEAVIFPAGKHPGFQLSTSKWPHWKESPILCLTSALLRCCVMMMGFWGMHTVICEDGLQICSMDFARSPVCVCVLARAHVRAQVSTLSEQVLAWVCKGRGFRVGVRLTEVGCLRSHFGLSRLSPHITDNTFHGGCQRRTSLKIYIPHRNRSMKHGETGGRGDEGETDLDERREGGKASRRWEDEGWGL